MAWQSSQNDGSGVCVPLVEETAWAWAGQQWLKGAEPFLPPTRVLFFVRLQVRVLQCVSSAVELLGDRLRPHLSTICAALPQVRYCGCLWRCRLPQLFLAPLLLPPLPPLPTSAEQHPFSSCCRPPPQVWQVISQRRQEGAGGLARLHSALISTGSDSVLHACSRCRHSTHP